MSSRFLSLRTASCRVAGYAHPRTGAIPKTTSTNIKSIDRCRVDAKQRSVGAACASGGFLGSVASFFGMADTMKDKAEGLEFLKKNADKEGIMCMESGLQYRVLRQGTGKRHPLAHSPCDCHYEGKLLDGTKFDSSYDRGAPTKFAPNQVIRGWTEAMQLMVEGDLWELYIPAELGYGPRGAGPIPGNATLIFKMEIMKVYR